VNTSESRTQTEMEKVNSPIVIALVEPVVSILADTEHQMPRQHDTSSEFVSSADKVAALSRSISNDLVARKPAIKVTQRSLLYL
jgi:hypothetical protein